MSAVWYTPEQLRKLKIYNKFNVVLSDLNLLHFSKNWSQLINLGHLETTTSN